MLRDLKDSIIADAMKLKGAATYRAEQLSSKYGLTLRTLVKVVAQAVPTRSRARTEADYRQIKDLYAISELVNDHQKFKSIAQMTRWSYATVKNVVQGRLDKDFNYVKHK